MRTRRLSGSLLLAAGIIALCATPAEAYIGPGAGFAVASSLFVILWTILLALLSLLLWPIRWVVRAIYRRQAFARAKVKRVVVLGLDGMEPTLAEQYMSEGRLPNLSKLAKQGSYCRLGTTLPAMTPVAWSTFMTGCNPGKHNVFDFLTVDRRNYLPMLSSVHIGEAKKTVRIGKYRIPISKPDMRLLRKGKPLWSILGEHGVFSTVIRMPITFPPERFRGVALSAMCIPDLRGTQGTFSFYTTRSEADRIYTGGEQVRVKRAGRFIRAHLVGPANSLRCDHAPMTAPFTVRFSEGKKGSVAELELGGERHRLEQGEYTPWIRFHFKAAPWAVEVGGHPTGSTFIYDDIGNLGKRSMEITRFSKTERRNYLRSTIAGRYDILKRADAIIKNPKDEYSKERLRRVQIDPDAVIKRGGVTKDELNYGSKRSWEQAQAIPTAESRPQRFALARTATEVGKTFFQFKGVPYRQTAMIFREAIGDLKYGRFEKLATLMTLFPAIGEIIQDTKALITGNWREDMSVLERYFDDLQAAFVLGIMGDMVYYGRSGVITSLFGPTVGFLGDVFRPKKLLRRIPIVGPRLYRASKKESEE